MSRFFLYLKALIPAFFVVAAILVAGASPKNALSLIALSYLFEKLFVFGKANKKSLLRSYNDIATNFTTFIRLMLGIYCLHKINFFAIKTGNLLEEYAYTIIILTTYLLAEVISMAGLRVFRTIISVGYLPESEAATKIASFYSFAQRIKTFKKYKEIIKAFAEPSLYILVASGLLIYADAIFILLLIISAVYFGQKIYNLIRYCYPEEYQQDFYSLACASPKIIFHISGARGASYQINQWLPVLEKLPFNVVIVIRELYLLKGLVETTIPVFYARAMRDVEMLKSDNLEVILYPSNATKNFQLFRWIDIKHIFINHGDSDKALNSSKVLRSYDSLFLAGRLAYDRLINSGININENAVNYVGRPQLEMSLKKRTNKEIKTLLYAPTWEGFASDANYTSVGEFGIKLVSLLAPAYKIIYRPHPYTGNVDRRLKEFNRQIKALVLQHNGEVDERSNIHDTMNESDLLISDVSSVVNDYVYTAKPIIMTNPHAIAIDIYREVYPTSSVAYIVAPDDDAMMLLNNIEANDQLEKTRESFIEYALGSHPDGALNDFIQALGIKRDA